VTLGSQSSAIHRAIGRYSCRYDYSHTHCRVTPETKQAYFIPLALEFRTRTKRLFVSPRRAERAPPATFSPPPRSHRPCSAYAYCASGRMTTRRSRTPHRTRVSFYPQAATRFTHCQGHLARGCGGGGRFQNDRFSSPEVFSNKGSSPPVPSPNAVRIPTGSHNPDECDTVDFLFEVPAVQVQVTTYDIIKHYIIIYIIGIAMALVCLLVW
jgi:hypothetical protein